MEDKYLEIFKPRFRVWLFRVYIPIGLASWVIYLGANITQFEVAIMTMGILIIGWILYANFLPLRHLNLIVGNRGIEGRQLRIIFHLPIFEEDHDVSAKYLFRNVQKYVGGYSFKFILSDVTAIWMGKNRLGRPSLFIATQSVTAIIPLPLFNSRKIWQAIKNYAPAEVLTDEARDNTVVKKAWRNHNLSFLEKLDKEIHIEIRKGILIVAYIVLLFLGYLLYISIVEKALWAILFFGFPVITIIKFVIRWPKVIVMSKESIKISTYIITSELPWSKIQKHSADSSFLRFYIGGKQYWIPGKYHWLGDDKEDAFSLIKAQINVQEIEYK